MKHNNIKGQENIVGEEFQRLFFHCKIARISHKIDLYVYRYLSLIVHISPRKVCMYVYVHKIFKTH